MGRTVGHPIGVDPVKPPPPTFEFYTLLPEMEEVVVPEEELAAPQPAGNAPAGKDTSASENAPTGREAPASANAPGGGNAPAGKDDSTDTARSANEAPTAAKPEGGPYIVQIASFRSLKDADSLKAKLILNGFNPVVQSVVLSGEEKRYRVRLGPYPDRASLEAGPGPATGGRAWQPAGGAGEEGLMERVMGIEPTSSAWEAEVLPLNYTRRGPASSRNGILLCSPARSTAGRGPAAATVREAPGVVPPLHKAAYRFKWCAWSPNVRSITVRRLK